jgi:transposase
MERLKSEDRLRILEMAVKTGNIAGTCRLFGISRASFYAWLCRYREGGLDGLEDRPRSRPQMPNRVSVEVEEAIIDYSRLFPGDGPRRISWELSERGITVGETGVYRVLLRRGLSRRAEREAAAGGPSAKPVAAGAALRKEGTLPAPPDNPRGCILAMNTLYLQGLGYLFSAVDGRSGFIFARLYSNRRAENAVQLLETRAFPLFRSLGLSLEGVATTAASEYQAAASSARHQLLSFLESRGLRQFSYRGLSAPIASGIEAFYATLRDEWLAGPPPRPELGEFIHRYNCARRDEAGSSAFERLRRSRDADEPLPLWCFLVEGLS